MTYIAEGPCTQKKKKTATMMRPCEHTKLGTQKEVKQLGLTCNKHGTKKMNRRHKEQSISRKNERVIYLYVCSNYEHK